MSRPVRLQLNEGSVTTMWREVPNFEHGTLCRVFHLDPATFSFDLPASVRGDGRVGAGSNDRRRQIEGYVLRHGRPVGIIHVAREGERFRDLDPTNRDDQLTLRQTA